jgi:heme-degrading monooxygenase HmoA
MVYVSVKQTVKDYGVWRPFFDNDAARRKAGGGTGSNQIYRDVDKPNDVTVILEWDSKENAQKFTRDPALREVMEKAGVVGMPSVIIQNKA